MFEKNQALSGKKGKGKKGQRKKVLRIFFRNMCMIMPFCLCFFMNTIVLLSVLELMDLLVSLLYDFTNSMSWMIYFFIINLID
jgi:hypothetical protein